MKKKWIMFLNIMLLFTFLSRAQTFQARLTGFAQLSEYEIMMLVQVRNLHPELSWAYSAGQYQLVFDPELLSGGRLQILIPEGLRELSDLPVGQRPMKENFFWSVPHQAIAYGSPPTVGGDRLMLLDDREWRTVVALMGRLHDVAGQEPMVFADKIPGWGFRPQNTRIFAADYRLEDGLCLRGKANGGPGHSSELASIGISFLVDHHQKQVAGSWFYGKGEWTEAGHWNVALKDSFPNYQQEVPELNNNVRIAGEAFIPEGKLVTLQSDVNGNGGQLLLAPPVNSLRGTTSKLVIEPGGGLRVTTFLNELDAGALVLSSSASGSGMLIHENAGVYAHVEKFMEGKGRTLLIGPPVIEQLTSSLLANTSLDGILLREWNPQSDRWQAIDPDKYSLRMGQGVQVLANQEQKLCFNGELQATDVTIFLSAPVGPSSQQIPSGSWHLLGNPFASNLIWDPVQWQVRNLCHSIQVWDEDRGSYRVLRPEENSMIGIGEGFFVYLEQDSAGSLLVPAAARVLTTEENQEQDLSGTIVLSAADSQRSLVQPTFIGFKQGATVGYDAAHDAPFLAGDAPQFYSVLEDRSLAVNMMEEGYEPMVIPLGFEVATSGNYLISLEQNHVGVPLVLYDRLLQRQHVLDSGSSYIFEAMPADDQGRFELHLGWDVSGVNYLPSESPRIWLEKNRLCISGQEPLGPGWIEVYDIGARLLMRTPMQPEGCQCVEVGALSSLLLVRLQGRWGISSRVVAGP